MRIIITRHGEEIIPSLVLHNKKALSIKKAHADSPSKDKAFDEKKLIEKKFLTIVKNKCVKIHQDKIILPKNVTDMYNTDNDLGESSIIGHSVLPMINVAQDKNFDNSLDKTYENTHISYSIREIIPHNVFKEIVKKIKNETEMKDKLSNLNDYRMRSPNRNYKNLISEFQSKLERKINLDNINLINYLNQKSIISENFIKQIAEYSDDRLNKINKMTQIYLHNLERNKISDKLLQNKLKIARSKEMEQYKYTLLNMEHDILKSAEILNRNKRTVPDKERYYFIHQEVQKSWEKFKVDKLINPKLRIMKNNKNNFKELKIKN